MSEEREIAFVSAGSAERDRELGKLLTLHDSRITSGECPNGDGLLVQGLDPIYPETWECPQCGFGYNGPARWLESENKGE